MFIVCCFVVNAFELNIFIVHIDFSYFSDTYVYSTYIYILDIFICVVILNDSLDLLTSCTCISFCLLLLVFFFECFVGAVLIPFVNSFQLLCILSSVFQFSMLFKWGEKKKNWAYTQVCMCVCMHMYI